MVSIKTTFPDGGRLYEKQFKRATHGFNNGDTATASTNTDTTLTNGIM